MIDPYPLRSQFPSLQQTLNGEPAVHFDNAAGTQAPQQVIDRMADYLSRYNANTAGAFRTSQLTDEMLRDTHAAAADFLGARSSREIVFGPNMTTLTKMLSASLAREMKPGDEIVTTRMEHDANVSPWLALEERGIKARFADINEDVTLNWKSFESALSDRTRLVAITYASNAFGTVNDVRRATQLAHDAGAWCLVDAVHYAPHGPIDVSETGCDFLVCSGYKFFGPHVGFLYGKEELLARLHAAKVRPAPDSLPDRFEWGTLNHEGFAGMLGAFEYLEAIGRTMETSDLCSTFNGRSRRLKLAMHAIRDYEQTLSSEMLSVLRGIDRVNVFGIASTIRLQERVPTFGVTVEGLQPKEVAKRLGERGIFVWDGNYYALEPMMRLGLEDRGGAVRISLVHYNTREEIVRLAETLEQIIDQ